MKDSLSRMEKTNRQKIDDLLQWRKCEIDSLIRRLQPNLDMNYQKMTSLGSLLTKGLLRHLQSDYKVSMRQTKN